MLIQKKYYPWLMVALLWVVGLLNYLDRQMLSTMKPAIMQDIPELKSATRFGELMGVFLWVYACMSPFAGMVADKVNRKWLIIASLFIWSAITLLMGYATTYQQLYWMRAAMGISEAIYIPASFSLIADFHAAKAKSLAIAAHITGFYVGQAVGGFGAAIAASTSWQKTFHLFGIAGIAYSLILIFFLKEKRSATAYANQVSGQSVQKESYWKSIPALLQIRAFWIMLFYFALPSIPGWAVKNWLPTLFSETLHINMSDAGPMATITIAASSFLGVLVGGYISDKWILKNLRARMNTSGIGLLLLLPALLLIGFGASLAALLLAAFLFGFGFGMFDANNMPIVQQIIPVKYSATAYGLMNMVGVFAGAFVTNAVGKSIDAGNLGQAFIIMMLLVTGILLVQVFFLKPAKPALAAEIKSAWQDDTADARTGRVRKKV